MSTISEENYMKAIFKLSGLEKKGVATSEIADLLETKASSVTDMIQKLAEKDLLNYTKYQGVTLTPDGNQQAVKIIRKHRLWELFLFQVLNFKWDEIHEIAEELEHIKSDALVERLDKFLNYPHYDPHGDPIPDEEGNFPVSKSIRLSYLPKNSKGIVAGVIDTSSVFLSYLEKVGIQIGTEIEIIEFNDFDSSQEIKINGMKSVHLSMQAVQNILITEK